MCTPASSSAASIITVVFSFWRWGGSNRNTQAGVLFPRFDAAIVTTVNVGEPVVQEASVFFPLSIDGFFLKCNGLAAHPEGPAEFIESDSFD